MRQHVARIRKLVRRLVDRAALGLRQYTNYPNLVVDLEHQALQRVMLVAQQSAMPLYCSDLHEMAAMPAISWAKSIRIHHESSDMQFAFFSSSYATTASRCRSNQVVTLTMLSQRVLQMRGNWLRSSEMKFCCRRRYATSNVNVE
jgi:hypothetical protein